MLAKLPLLVLAVATTVQAFNAFDCKATENSRSEIIDATGILPCQKLNPSSLKEITAEIQILQLKQFETQQITVCRARKLSNIFHCGLFSHTSLQEVNSIPTILYLNEQECRRMATKGEFVYHHRLHRGINFNSTTKIKVSPYGKLLPTGECQGDTFTYKGRFFKKSVLQEEFEFTLESYSTKYNIQTEELQIEQDFACNRSLGYCSDNHGLTAIWDLDNNECQIDILYEGPAIIQTANNSDKNQKLLIDNKDFILHLSLLNFTKLCDKPAINTDHENLLVSFKRGDYTFITENQEILNENVNFPLYVNSKINYIADIMDFNLREAFAELAFHQCKLKAQFILHRIDHVRKENYLQKHVITGMLGYLSILSGDTIVITPCTEVKVTIRHTEKCYNTIPIHYNGLEKFVDTNTQSIIDYGTEVPCLPIFPPKYKIQNQWYLVHPFITEVKPPTKISPDYVDKQKAPNFKKVTHTLNKGIYPLKTIQKFNLFLKAPSRKRAAINYVSNRLANNEELSVLNLYSDEDMSKFSEKIKINLWVTYIGSIFGLIAGIYN